MYMIQYDIIYALIPPNALHQMFINRSYLLQYSLQLFDLQHLSHPQSLPPHYQRPAEGHLNSQLLLILIIK